MRVGILDTTGCKPTVDIGTVTWGRRDRSLVDGTVGLSGDGDTLDGRGQSREG